MLKSKLLGILLLSLHSILDIPYFLWIAIASLSESLKQTKI